MMALTFHFVHIIEFLEQAKEVQLAAGPGKCKRLSQDCSIEGVLILSSLTLLLFPASFPLGFMHLMFENVIPGLVDLWSHGFDPNLPDDNNFIIAPGAWKAIGEGQLLGTPFPHALAQEYQILLPNKVISPLKSGCSGLFTWHLPFSEVNFQRTSTTHTTWRW
jgi:hypothetical protein